MSLTIAALFAPFIILIFPFALVAYMAKVDMEEIDKAFRQSRIIHSYLEGWRGGSIPSRCTPLLIVIGAIVWPNVHVSRGDLLPEELHNLPRGVLLRMRWVAGLICLSCAWLVALFVWGKYFK
ncbi:hypothetical protein [Pseudomonas sp. SCB32]|uniref:hypothetical protein n=1 Tax=Pseudomonas sp. SCB32 TaxID=2653853 RepID=UPI0012657CA8|nr:hypothetical protein [Pseudomonas sp. SCB32]